MNIAALRPYLGYGAIRLAENAGRSHYNSLQISADRRYTNGLKVGVAYTLGKSKDNASDKRNVLWNTYDDTNYWGPSNFDRRHVLNVYYIYDLPFWREQDTLLKNLAGRLADFGRDASSGPARRSRSRAPTTSPASATAIRPAVEPRRRSDRRRERAVLGRHRQRPELLVQPGGVRRAGGRHLRQRAAQPAPQPWPAAVGHRAASRTSASPDTQKIQFRAEIFNFINHPNWNNVASSDPSNANFGRVTTKRDERRDVQLSLRYQF